MKRRTNRLLAWACSLALMAGMALPATAAEAAAPGISVQLDGKTLAFTDAAPQARDGRTFLPFRAVMEAMGAQVDGSGSTVTATRGGRTLTMTVGSVQAAVTENGVTVPITMDVAPYVDSATWRTYAPVRFAAQAFGCAVGWDGAANTAVIVDTEKLAGKAAANYQYTMLEKLSAYGDKFKTGNWALDGKMDMSAAYFSQNILAAGGAFQGTISESTAAQISMDLNMDMTGLYNLLTSMGADAGSADPAEMKQAISMDLRMDLSAGMLYLKLDDAMNAQLGVPAGTWLSMDLNSVLAASGMGTGLAGLMAASDSGANLSAAVAEMLSVSAADAVNHSATAYQTISGLADSLARSFSDSGFAKVSGGYAATYSLKQDGADTAVTLTLFTDAKDNVTGYRMDLSAVTPIPQENTPEAAAQREQLAAMGLSMDNVTIGVKVGMSDADGITGGFTLAAGSMVTVNMNLTSACTATDKAPETAPPAGAAVVDLTQLLQAAQ